MSYLDESGRAPQADEGEQNAPRGYGVLRWMWAFFMLPVMAVLKGPVEGMPLYVAIAGLVGVGFVALERKLRPLEGSSWWKRWAALLGLCIVIQFALVSLGKRVDHGVQDAVTAIKEQVEDPRHRPW